jgi:CRISPR system Cascade subunit CasC
MGQFIQLHLLTSYPPANLNRDDLGRPKTAVMGGTQRLRISSQSLKRAWRTSEVFESSLKGSLGTRTKRKGMEVFEALKMRGIAESDAGKWAREIAEVFGEREAEPKDDPLKGLQIKQLFHFSPEELASIDGLVDKLVKTKRGPSEDDLVLLREKHKAVDVSMFGRMLAEAPKFNTDAAVQVAHAITVHEVAVEDDYFTAVDDLNKGEEDAGAGHIGETEFAAGLFYLYVCVNRDLLVENLQGDTALANKALHALVEAAAKVAPTGKQNSFASRARASYVLAEKGTEQPRSLSAAFLKPVIGKDMLSAAIAALTETRENMDKVYGPCAEKPVELNAVVGTGKLDDIKNFVAS